MSKNDGGSAFPVVDTEVHYDEDGEKFNRTFSEGGMTLRDWFAGQAPEPRDEDLARAILVVDARNKEDHDLLRVVATAEARAFLAYLYADAMLKERNKT